MQDGYADALKLIASHFNNNSTVIGFDLFNEPTGQFSYDLSSFYERVGNKIYNVNPKLLLIFQNHVFVLSHFQLDVYQHEVEP